MKLTIALLSIATIFFAVIVGLSAWVSVGFIQ